MGIENHSAGLAILLNRLTVRLDFDCGTSDDWIISLRANQKPGESADEGAKYRD